MMANTGVSILPPGEAGVLTSPIRQGTAKTECINFWYHMGGENPGETPSQDEHTHKHTLRGHEYSGSPLQVL